ncbi:hypothetical protein NKJ86_13810 [Mesorhizobium sp. M0025]|uniref:hypothetical protein n=1 Tax=Mesorhizobium sp. M0025 TaxID=2956846 RepID=UPI0033356486
MISLSCRQPLLRTIILASLLCILGLSARAADDPLRKIFAQDLARSLLGSPDVFRELSTGQGWRGIVLAAPGSSIAPLTEAFSGQPGDFAQSLANMTVFDRPVQVYGGFAAFAPRTLDVAWKSILEHSRPPVPLPRDRMLKTAVMKWLFKPIFKKGKVTGYTREPSRYAARYRKFEDTYTQLLRGRTNDMWRLDPRLKNYSSFQQAQDSIVREWFKSGYKAEIESATWSFQSSATGGDWQKWATADQLFEAHRTPVGLYSKIPETYLLPPPASWSSVSSWLRAVSDVPGGQYRYQLARIKVERPWFDLDSLLSGALTPSASLSTDGSFEISDGSTPSFEKMPEGVLPAFVEELIIVRGIAFSQTGASQPAGHPLSSFAYPDAINLVGYVVRVLPRQAVNTGPNASGQN